MGPIISIIYVMQGQPAETISNVHADDLKSYSAIHDQTDTAPFTKF